MIEIFKGMKLGFIAPHTYENQGAKSEVKDMTEFQYAQAMLFNIYAPFTSREKSFDEYYAAIQGLKLYGVTGVVEPHFNAFNGRCSGYEFLVIEGDTVSEEFARYLVGKFKVKFPHRTPRHDDGVKHLTPTDRGFKNLEVIKKSGMRVAIISELFFGDNPFDFLPTHSQLGFWQEVIGDLSTLEKSRSA